MEGLILMFSIAELTGVGFPIAFKIQDRKRDKKIK